MIGKQLLIILLAISLTAFPLTVQAEYMLVPGDILTIQVWGYDEFDTKAIEIRPDGEIDFPLVGTLKAGGVTTKTLAEILSGRLSFYLRDPHVSINIAKYHTTRVYVLGEVNKPGLYELTKRHNLLDAIGSAGGYTADAAKKKVYVIPAQGEIGMNSINLLELLKKGDTRQNIPLAEGDTVYLTSNNRIDFSRDILPFITGAYYIRELGQR